LTELSEIRNINIGVVEQNHLNSVACMDTSIIVVSSKEKGYKILHISLA